MTSSLPRQLRINQTEVEKRLWYRIRNRQIGGVKFRRQEPIGSYVVDFVSFEPQMVIELDGGQHAEEIDAARTAWLRSQGFSVLRFWNNEVIENIEGVLERIAQEVEIRQDRAATPHPVPLPQGERES